MPEKKTTKPKRPRGRPRKKRVEAKPQVQACCEQKQCCLSKICICKAFGAIGRFLKSLVGR